MKIRTKVTLAFSLLVGLILIEVFVKYRQERVAEHELVLFEKSTIPETAMVGDLIRIAAKLDTRLQKQGQSVSSRQSDQALLAEFSTALSRAYAASATGISVARDQGDKVRVKEEEAELSALQKIQGEFEILTNTWRAQADTARTEDEQVRLRNQASIQWTDKLGPLLHQYQRARFDEFMEQTRDSMRRSQHAFFSIVNVGILVVVAAILVSIWVVRAVTKPLHEAVTLMKDIAAGATGKRLQVQGGGEFAVLARSLNVMLDRQEELIRTGAELRALADRRLREFDDFFSLSMDAFVIANTQGYFVRINRATVELLGYSEAEILAKPFMEFVHPDDRKSTTEEMTRLMTGQPTLNFENRYLCSDGSWKWISWHVNPNPEKGLMYAVGRDVTGKKNTEMRLHESQHALCELNARLETIVAERTKGLHESEERFRLLVEGVSDYAIYMLDVDGRIASWNAGAQHIKGYTAEEIIGQHFSKFYSAIDLEKGKPMYGLELAKSRGRFEDNGWRICKDGRRFWAHVVINALHDKNGVLQGFAKITRDITEQKRISEELTHQQEMLRSLMENLAEGVVACDANGKLTFFNKASRDWHGTDILAVPPEKWAESFGICASDGTTPLPMEEIPLVRAAAGEHVRDAEMVIVRKDHPPRWIVASGDPLLSANGTMIGAVVVMKDITERRNAERRNRRTQRLESLGTLAGGIAHDLNNALAPILMGMELLKIQYRDSASIVVGMEKSALRGAGMVRQLLTFAKGVDGDRLPLPPRKFVEEMKSIITHSFPKNIDCQLAIDDDVRPVLGDATQLHQVLLNLCVNARDAMPDGGTLTIAVGNRQVPPDNGVGSPALKPGDYVCIRVSDTGTGIPPSVMEHIFDPFFTTKPVDKGTGLGLSTVMGIVRSHGGWVQVSSVPNKGSSFDVWLPAASGNGKANTTNPFLQGVDFSGDNRLVLVVDDEPAVREISRTMLQALDFQVITAEDGEWGLKQVESVGSALSLILSDWHMPKMDGMMFATKVHQLLPNVPLILSSGRMERADPAKLAAAGVSAVLHKPFTQRDLVNALRTALAPRNV